MPCTAWRATSDPAPKANPWARVGTTPESISGGGTFEVISVGSGVWGYVGGFVCIFELRGPNPVLFGDP